VGIAIYASMDLPIFERKAYAIKLVIIVIPPNPNMSINNDHKSFPSKL